MPYAFPFSPAPASIHGVSPKNRRPRRLLGVAEQIRHFPTRKTAPTNVLFRYLYRDASNYKQYGEAVFTNRTFLAPDEIERRIRACLDSGNFFIARQVNLEERFFESLYEDDHPWHEFDGLESTTLAAFDPENWNRAGHRRDVTEFLADLEAAHRAGWDETRTCPAPAVLRERRKQDTDAIPEWDADSLGGGSHD